MAVVAIAVVHLHKKGVGQDQRREAQADGGERVVPHDVSQLHLGKVHFGRLRCQIRGAFHYFGHLSCAWSTRIAAHSGEIYFAFRFTQTAVRWKTPIGGQD